MELHIERRWTSSRAHIQQPTLPPEQKDQSPRESKEAISLMNIWRQSKLHQQVCDKNPRNPARLQAVCGLLWAVGSQLYDIQLFLLRGHNQIDFCVRKVKKKKKKSTKVDKSHSLVQLPPSTLPSIATYNRESEKGRSDLNAPKHVTSLYLEDVVSQYQRAHCAARTKGAEL